MKNGCLQSIFKLTVEPRADREGLPIYELQGGKESRKQTGPGAEGGHGGGDLKRGAMQGELLKALGEKHSKSIETNRVPPAPSRAQRHSSQPD